MSKPRVMSAPDLIQCLSWDLLTDPALLVETIREEESALALVRKYGRGEASYIEVREAVSAVC